MFLFNFFKMANKRSLIVYLSASFFVFLFSILLSIFVNVIFSIGIVLWFILTFIVSYYTDKFAKEFIKQNEQIKKYAQDNNLPLINLTHEDFKKLKTRGVLKVDDVETPIVYQEIKGINT